MLIEWVYALASVIAISSLSLVGLATASLGINKLKKVLIVLVSFSAGALLGGAFFHLLPEAGEAGFTAELALMILAGIMTSFVLEKIVCWRHCHVPTSKEHPHPFAYMNLFGDAVHNLIDGMIIGATYLASIPLGITTTLAVIFHEIPQEMGDFGVLVHGGFSVRKAIAMNFLTALTAVIGAGIALATSAYAASLIPFLLPFAAGSFIYIASSDLIPELHKQPGLTKALAQLVFIMLGLGLMYWLAALE